VLNVLQAHKSFLTHPLVLLGDGGHVESHSDPFIVEVIVGAR
jgi:hypothetical protein